MKITIEITIPDEEIEHHSIAERVTQRAIEELDQGMRYRYLLEDRLHAFIEAKWEFQWFSGSKNNERNPS